MNEYVDIDVTKNDQLLIRNHHDIFILINIFE